MKTRFILACIGVVILAVALTIWPFVDNVLAPLFLNSRIERLHETGLPKISIEDGKVVYCRMKADDFRFPLPPGSHANHPSISGGFDTIDGSVEVNYEPGRKKMDPESYQSWLADKVPIGGDIRAETIPGGLLIKFHYFGDR